MMGNETSEVTRRSRFWELYNKYKDDMQEVLEFIELMKEFEPRQKESEAENENER